MTRDPTTYPSLDQQISDGLTAFKNGKLDEIAALLTVPTSVYVRESMILVSDVAQVAQVLGIYFANLKAHGYDHSRHEILDQTVEANGRIRVQTKIALRRSDGEIITSVQVNFFGHFNEDGIFIVSLVHSLGQNKNNPLLSGLPLT